MNEVVRRGKSILPVVSYCTKFDICASNDVSIHLGLKFAISFLFSHVQSSLKLLEPYLTLPYLPDKTFYCLALRSPRGSLRIPELTVRLQNLQVHNSPGSTPVMGLFPSPSENTLLGLPTVRQSQYLRELQLHKHSNPGCNDLQIPNQENPGDPSPELNIKLQNSQVQYPPGSSLNWNYPSLSEGPI